jgi:Mce-associated membrane protein
MTMTTDDVDFDDEVGDMGDDEIDDMVEPDEVDEAPARRSTRTRRSRRVRRGRNGRWRLPVSALLVAALVAGLTVAGYYGTEWNRANELRNAQHDAVAAARQVVLNFVTFQEKSLDEDLSRVADGATGEFAEEFETNRPQLEQVVSANKMSSRGEILEAGLVSGDRDSAVVLVVADATVTNVQAPKGREVHYRIQVDMSLDDGRWKVATLAFVG